MIVPPENFILSLPNNPSDTQITEITRERMFLSRMDANEIVVRFLSVTARHKCIWLVPLFLISSAIDGCTGLSVVAAEAQPEAQVVSGELKKWHRVTITFEGPAASEGDPNNPFLDYRLNVTFTKGVRSITAPGFYAADGNAGETSATGGNKWRVHFMPDEEGTWTYTASFRTGSNIAVSDALGTSVSPDGASGSFTIGPTDKTGRDHRAKGLLRYVGQHYLRFGQTGEYFLKGGADSPENFLGYNEFDGTYDAGGGEDTQTWLPPDGLHKYGPHVAHWNPGDPTWQGGKGKGIIGALNYLSGRGMNSVYFLTFNTGGVDPDTWGDGGDSWMWTEPIPNNRFDCSKLDQWEIVFSHMDAKGIQLHVVTQEAENDQVLDGGALGIQRKLYYRELVARFSHHHAIMWNLGEENQNTPLGRLDRTRAYAEYIRSLDLYDHPITVHTEYFPPEGDSVLETYGPLFGDPNFEATSYQGSGFRYNYWARIVRQQSASSVPARPWAFFGDENYDQPVQEDLSNLLDLRHLTWGNLLGGGSGVEFYFDYQGFFGDVTSEDWTVIELLWDHTRHALAFFQNYLPFTQMEGHNELVGGSNDRYSAKYCFALPGQVYAVYLTGETTTLQIESGTYAVRWYNPRSGALENGSVTSVTGPGLVSLGDAPAEPTLDWVILVRRDSGVRAAAAGGSRSSACPVRGGRSDKVPSSIQGSVALSCEYNQNHCH